MNLSGLRPPRAAALLAAAGIVVLVGPLIALALGGGLAGLGDAVRSDAVRTALRLTLVTSLLATALATVLGVALALIAERAGGVAGRLAGLASEVPLVVPPVVTGLGLLLLLGRDGILGALIDAANLQVTFTSTAVVLAQASVAIPMVVLSVRAGLSALDPLPEQSAAVHGATPLQRTIRVTLPSVRGAIMLGAVLAWGRAAGEFGATITFAGSLPGTTRTLPLQVFADLQTSPGLAAAAALIQVAVAVAALTVARSLRTRLDAS